VTTRSSPFLCWGLSLPPFVLSLVPPLFHGPTPSLNTSPEVSQIFLFLPLPRNDPPSSARTNPQLRGRGLSCFTLFFSCLSSYFYPIFIGRPSLLPHCPSTLPLSVSFFFFFFVLVPHTFPHTRVDYSSPGRLCSMDGFRSSARHFWGGMNLLFFCPGVGFECQVKNRTLSPRVTLPPLF